MTLIARLSPLTMLLIVAACGATPPAQVSPSPTSEPDASTGPTSAPSSPSAGPSAAPPSASAGPTVGTTSPSPGGPTPAPAVRPSPSFAPTPDSGSGWSGPDRVSERGYHQPSLAVDGGVTMMAYVAAGLNDSIWLVTNDEGNTAGRWTRERLSSPPRGYVDEQPSIAIDESSGMYIAFTRMYDSELGRFPEGIYLLSRGDGSDWSGERLLVGEGAHSPSLVVREGVIHLAFVLGAPSDIIEDDPSFPLMYGNDAGGGFGSIEVAGNGAQPQLALDGQGRPHILFGSPFWANVGVQYAVGSAGGGSFSLERLPGTSGDEGGPVLALDPSDRPHAAWGLWPEGAARPSVHYSRRTEDGWSAPSAVVGDALVTSLVVDYLGGVHLAAGGEDGVWYAYGNGGPFASQRLSSLPALALDLAPPVGPHGGPEVHLIFVGGRDERVDGLWYGVGRVD